MRGNLLRSLCFPACSPRRSPLTWHALKKLHVGPRQCADEVLRDLPRVADVRIAQRLLTPAEPGRLTETEQLAGPRGVTGNLTDPKPSTSRLRSPVHAVSSTLNAVCASPRSVLASRSRAALAMAGLPNPRKPPYLLARL